MLVRTDSNVGSRANTVEIPSINHEETILLKFKWNDKQFEICPVNTNQPNNRLWLVISNLKETGYKIKKHDIFKLSRMKFKVKEFRNEHEYFDEFGEKSPHKGFDEIKNIIDNDATLTNNNEEENLTCRFC